MRIIHRFGFCISEQQQKQLEALGVKSPSAINLPGDHPFVAFDVAENHPNWPQIYELLQHWDSADSTIRTEFSKKEIRAAHWLELGAWHNGYPQPDEDNFGYQEATYDLSDFCEQCGIGTKQKAPFQLKNEPKWGKRGIFQLIWVYDEFFVTPDVWAHVFEPHGIGCRHVINTKGIELKTVVQLVVDEEISIATEGLHHERCDRCGRLKYIPVTRGMFPALTSRPSQAMVKTTDYFGSGGQADKRVLISQDLALSLADKKVRGALLKPAAEL